MSDISPADTIDLADPATAAQYLKICRSVLDKLSTPEAVARFLEEMAERFASVDPDFAGDLRALRDRLASGDGWTSDDSLFKDVKVETVNRLGQEERDRVTMIAPPGKVRVAKSVMIVIGFTLLVGFGAAIWGVLYFFGVSPRNALAAGATVAVIIFAVYVRALNRALGEMIIKPEGDS